MQYRSLLAFLVRKELKVQFAQTALGLGWLALRPLLNVLVMTLIFGMIARIPSDGIPYLLFAMSGMLPWAYFSSVSTRGAASLISQSALITKVYFPRVFLPLSAVIMGLVEFMVVLLLFLLISHLGFGRPLHGGLLWLPVPAVLLLLLTAGTAIWLSALAVDFRDVRHATNYLLQLLMFTAPVIWPVSLLEQRLGGLGDAFLAAYAWYPLVGVVEGFRAALLGLPLPWDYLAKGAAVSALLLASGIAYFRYRESLMADVV